MKALSKLELSRLIAIAVWLLFIVIQTGTNGIMAILDATVFGVFLLLATVCTRTVRLRTLLSLFALGGFAMGVAAVLTMILLPGTNSTSFFRLVMVSVFENGAFLIPPAVILWKGRHNLCSLGASDVMLMVAASATGYFLMEEAFIRLHNEWSQGPFFFAPAVTWTGNRIAGDYLCASHPVWGVLAGAGIGLALVARTRGKGLFWPIAAVGIGLGLFDHFANNYNATMSSSAFRSIATATMLGGWLPLVVSMLGLIAAVSTDLWMNFKILPERMRFRGPFNAEQHALAYEHFYAQNTGGDEKYRAEVLAGMRLAKFISEDAPPETPAPKT